MLFLRDNEEKLIEEIIKKISDSLDLIRMDSSRTEEIRKYLDKKWGDFYTIGIMGKKGIGKSTIAQDIFKTVSKQFDASCFLSNIKDECSKVDGLFFLKKTLYQQLLGISVEPSLLKANGGVNNVLRNKLCSKKVLIILDDIDDSSHVEALVGKYGQSNIASHFGKGSRIIIISSTESVLNLVDEKCEVKELGFHQAKDILLRRARGREHLDGEFLKYLATEIIISHDACRFPLVVNVLGSFLCQKKQKKWKKTVDKLKKLKKDDPQDIYGPLEIGIKGLKKLKQSFLDIACFFRGEDQYRVRKILEGCGRTNDEIKCLDTKSLITIEGNKLWMHDLLQEIGHKYVCKRPKRTKLWLYNKHHMFANDTVNNTIALHILLYSRLLHILLFLI